MSLVEALDSARASLEDMSTIALDLRNLKSVSLNVNASTIDNLISSTDIVLSDTELLISDMIASFNESFLALDSFNLYLYHGYQCLDNLLSKLIFTNQTYIKYLNYLNLK